MWMNERIVREIVEGEAERLVPGPINLWPSIAGRRRKQRLRKVVRRGAMAVLLAFLVALLAWPQFRIAVAGVIWRTVGLRSGPGQPTMFNPTPPFVVWQPGYLPPGFMLVRTIYNPGFDPKTIPTALALAGNPTPAAALTPDTHSAILSDLDPDLDLSWVSILLIYRGLDNTEFQIYQRAAFATDPVSMDENSSQAAGQWLQLRWIKDGTWLVLRGNMARDELLRVAERLAVTSRPDANTSTESDFPAPSINVNVIPVVNPTEAQRQLPFHIPQPTWLPEGLILKGAHVDPPNWANVFYGRAEGGEAGFGFEIHFGPREGGYVYADSAKRKVLVSDQPATCVRGAWNERGEWNDSADATTLEWSANGFDYHMSQSELDLTCDDLIRIAESLR
jgi:hypothetical protein